MRTCLLFDGGFTRVVCRNLYTVDTRHRYTQVTRRTASVSKMRRNLKDGSVTENRDRRQGGNAATLVRSGAPPIECGCDPHTRGRREQLCITARGEPAYTASQSCRPEKEEGKRRGEGGLKKRRNSYNCRAAGSNWLGVAVCGRRCSTLWATATCCMSIKYVLLEPEVALSVLDQILRTRFGAFNKGERE